MPVDVADAEQVFAAADRVERELGPIDVWVNVAFTSVFAPSSQISPAEYRRVTEVSYLGYVYGTMAALQRMKPRDRGTIVQVGSALAYRGIPLQTAYCGAKHAIQGFHEALRCELLHEHSNVHVTMVQMPAVNTPQFSWVLSRLPHHAQPVPPIYQPELAARAVLYAADHPQRREYWVGSQHRRAPSPRTRSPPASWTATWPAPDSTRSRPRNARTRTRRSTCGTRPTAQNGQDFGAHGIFDDTAHERDPQLWASQHHGLLAVVAAGVSAAAALRWLRREERSPSAAEPPDAGPSPPAQAALLLTQPPGVLGVVVGGRDVPPAWIVRLLGVRTLAQSAAEFTRPRRDVLIIGVGVDAAHAASMLAAAKVRPRYRRAARSARPAPQRSRRRSPHDAGDPAVTSRRHPRDGAASRRTSCGSTHCSPTANAAP